MISSNGHYNLITYSEKKKASFRLTKSNLSDDFIEALREEFLSYRTNSTLSGLSFHQFLIEHLSQTGYVYSWGWLMTNVLNEMFTGFNPFSWRQNRIQNIFTTWFCFHWWQLLFLGTYIIATHDIWVSQVYNASNLDSHILLMNMYTYQNSFWMDRSHQVHLKSIRKIRILEPCWSYCYLMNVLTSIGFSYWTKLSLGLPSIIFLSNMFNINILIYQYGSYISIFNFSKF